MKSVAITLVALLSMAGAARADAPVRKGHIILNATQFLADIPQGDSTGAAGGGGRGRGGGTATATLPTTAPITAATALPPNFTFESFNINLRVPDPFSAKATIPAGDGPWYLYVRSRGTATSSFKIALNGILLPETFGTVPSAFQVSGPLTLQPGPIKVTIASIQGNAASFNVMLLSHSKDLKETDLPALQYPEDIVLLKEYNTVRPDGVKFGDLNGDGKTDFVVLTKNYSCYAYDNSGKELWHYDAPENGTTQRSEFEAPGSVWDFDHDGRAEVIHWRSIDGKEYLVMSDGMTGEIKHKVEWPNNLPPNHVYNNFRTAIAKTHEGYPDTLLVYTDSGGTVSLNAYGPTLNLLWSYSHPRLKDYHGHYIYPIDINKDGIDEIYISHVMLDAAGKEIWNNYNEFPDNHDHIDSARLVDLNGDGKLELVTGQSDVGTVVYDALTGKLLWQRFSNHTQKIEAGNYITTPGVPTPQVVASSRYYVPSLGAHLRYFQTDGTPISIWPNIPIPSNPNFAKGDFRGDGIPQLFWYRFLINPDGTGTLAFPDEVFHMFDFMQTGNDQAITVNPAGIVRVYGFKGAQQHTPNKDPLFLAHNVSNHTHY